MFFLRKIHSFPVISIYMYMQNFNQDSDLLQRPLFDRESKKWFGFHKNGKNQTQQESRFKKNFFYSYCS